MDKYKNHKNPLNRMGGRAPGASLPLWPYKSKLLKSQPKASHHLLSEGIILFKAINLKNRFRDNIIQRIPEFFVCML